MIMGKFCVSLRPGHGLLSKLGVGFLLICCLGNVTEVVMEILARIGPVSPQPNMKFKYNFLYIFSKAVCCARNWWTYIP